MTNLMDIRHQLTAVAKKESSWENNFEYTQWNSSVLLEMTLRRTKKIDEMWSKWLAMDEWKSNNMEGINFFSFTSISDFFSSLRQVQFSLAIVVAFSITLNLSQTVCMPFKYTSEWFFSFCIYVLNELQITLNYKTFFYPFTFLYQQ